jgi:preprotein translocase subunit SecY
MVSAFLNTVKIPELRRRILFTLAIVVIVRLGAAITTPGVNQAVIQEGFHTSLLFSICSAAARSKIARSFPSESCPTSAHRL